MTLRRTFAWTSLGLAAAISWSGCVVEIDFSPLGSDFGVEGSWTINGQTPTTERCTAAGIDKIAVIFWQDGKSYKYDDLTFDCTVGSFSTARILKWGSYQTQWVAYDDDVTPWAELGSSARQDLIVNSPNVMAVLNAGLPMNFTVTLPYNPSGTDFELRGGWTIGGADADAASCASEGIVDVVMVVYAATDTAFADGYEVIETQAPCEDGVTDTKGDKVLQYGSYWVAYRGLDASGNPVAGAETDPTLAGLLVVNTPTAGATAADGDFPK